MCSSGMRRGAGRNVLHCNRDGARESAAFEYDPKWLGSTARFAIDPTLALVAGPQFHKKPRDGSTYPGAIADTEPDGWGRRVILRDHAKRRAEARQVGDTERTLVRLAISTSCSRSTM